MTDALPATLTTAQAADVLETTAAGVWNLVLRGRLTPIRPGAKPTMFHTGAVFDLQVDRRTAATKAEHAAIWAAVDRIVAGQDDR